MLGKTHFIAGAATVALVTQEPAAIALAGVGALLPDIDHPGSIAGGWTGGYMRGLIGLILIGVGFYLPNGLGAWLPGSAFVITGALLCIVAMIPHRGITHSLLALFIAANFLPLPLALGYTSHLVLDAFSGGIPLFWPWKKRFGLRVFATGSIGDTLFGVSSLVLLISILFIN
jgi:inner membrane protein